MIELVNGINPFVKLISSLMAIGLILWRGFYVYNEYKLKKDFNNKVLIIIAFGVAMVGGSYAYSKLKDSEISRANRKAK